MSPQQLNLHIAGEMWVFIVQWNHSVGLSVGKLLGSSVSMNTNSGQPCAQPHEY